MFNETTMKNHICDNNSILELFIWSLFICTWADELMPNQNKQRLKKSWIAAHALLKIISSLDIWNIDFRLKSTILDYKKVILIKIGLILCIIKIKKQRLSIFAAVFSNQTYSWIFEKTDGENQLKFYMVIIWFLRMLAIQLVFIHFMILVLHFFDHLASFLLWFRFWFL